MTTTQPSLKKNLPILAILVAAGAAAYMLPYFRSYYYDDFLEYFHLTNTQMGTLGSAYGITAMISYFLGGFVADRFSARKMLTFALLSTGILGFVMLTFPSYPINLAIHGIWGVTTILSFWPPLMKAIRMLAAPNEQGKAFGFFEGGRGIVNAVLMAAVLALYGFISTSLGTKIGLCAVIIVYSALCVLLGVLVFFLVKDTEGEVSAKFDYQAALRVVKMPHTWLIVLIMFCSYSMNMSFYYITPYATSAFGTSAVFAAALTILAQWVRPVASFGAGFLGDRLGGSKVMLIGFVLMIAGQLCLIFIPADMRMMAALIVACVAMYLSMYICQSMHYTLLEEGDYPVAISGTAVGIVATLGYLPEWVCPWIAGRMLDAYPGNEGYVRFFGILVAFSVVGIIATLVWLKLTTAKRAEIRALNKKK